MCGKSIVYAVLPHNCSPCIYIFLIWRVSLFAITTSLKKVKDTFIDVGFTGFQLCVLFAFFYNLLFKLYELYINFATTVLPLAILTAQNLDNFLSSKWDAFPYYPGFCPKLTHFCKLFCRGLFKECKTSALAGLQQMVNGRETLTVFCTAREFTVMFIKEVASNWSSIIPLGGTSGIPLNFEDLTFLKSKADCMFSIYMLILVTLNVTNTLILFCLVN